MPVFHGEMCGRWVLLLYLLLFDLFNQIYAHPNWENFSNQDLDNKTMPFYSAVESTSEICAAFCDSAVLITNAATFHITSVSCLISLSLLSIIFIILNSLSN